MDQVESLLKRPKSYDNIDGTGELGSGFMLMGFALIVWLQAHTSEGAIWHKIYVLFIWIALMSAIIHYGTKAIKKYITYPRTGFVAYRKQGRIWTMILAFVLGALASAGFALAVRSHWDVSTPAFFYGLFFSASYAFSFARTVRWKRAVALALLIGSVAIALVPGTVTAALAGGGSNPTWFPSSEVGAFLLCMMLYGPTVMLSGAISLWLYLHNTHAPEKETDEPANQGAL